MSRTRDHWFIFVIGLLYPAILGALIYIAYSRILGPESETTATEHLVVVLLLLAVFIVDFLWTADSATKTNYSWKQGSADTVITLLIFAAVTSVLDGGLEQLSTTCYCMAAIKGVSFLWEFASRSSKVNMLAILVHLVLSMLYFSAPILPPSYLVWALALLLVIDLLVSGYMYYTEEPRGYSSDT